MTPQVQPHSSSNIFRFIGQLLPLLLGWSAASIAAGVVLRRSQDRQLRGLADQLLAWGTIDGLIAAAGIAGAHKQATQVAAGALDLPQQARQARRFEWLAWANAALDLGYIAGGSNLARRSPDNPYRRGAGLGVVFQGAFLLGWDIFLAWSIRKYRRGRLP